MKQNIIKITHTIPLFLLIFCFLTNVNAQYNNSELPTSIDANGTAPDASAMLDVQATDKGILIPRVANTSAISNPAEGLVVYDNANNDFKFYDGSEWQSMGLKYISFPDVQNTFLGVNAGVSNTTGNTNTATGYNALSSNTIGIKNTANGHGALLSNTEGDSNTAIGVGALRENTTGGSNTAIGAGALVNNTTGGSNIAVGGGTLGANTEGVFNTAIGSAALVTNTTGGFNTAIGRATLANNTIGGSNTATGWAALASNTVGNENTATGRSALNANTTGIRNTAVGTGALNANTIGNLNTAIGYRAFLNDSTYSNSTALGHLALPTGSNQVRLGNSDVTSIGGYANWSNISDARFKTHIQSNVPGLAFISRLRPVTYQMDMDAIAKHQHTPDSLRLAESEQAKAAIRYTGFLAQEVEQAAESLGYDFSGVDAPQHELDNYSLRYAEFVVPLVKAVQELEAENKTLRAHNADLEARLGKIEALLRQRVE